MSLVFCLLGSAIAVSIYKISNDPTVGAAEIGHYINATRALGIVSAILLSVVIAFTCGTAIMYLSRLIFTFRYIALFRRYGSLWCGASLTAIVYFAVFKGLKNALRDNTFLDFVDHHLALALLICWAGCTLLLFIVQRMKINILRITILSGTFALALAFAGNDLVNFIGVPVAGFDAYGIAREAGSTTMLADGGAQRERSGQLPHPAGGGRRDDPHAVDLEKALHVTETELSLTAQGDDGSTQYGSSAFRARSCARPSASMPAWSGSSPNGSAQPSPNASKSRTWSTPGAPST